MYKKILAFCMALIALAITPAAASASPQLFEGATAVATGSAVTGTNVGNIVFTNKSFGDITCTKAHLAGTVTANGGKLIEGNIESASFTGEAVDGFCSSTNGTVYKVTPEVPWCIKSSVLGAASIRGGKCSEAARPVTFTLDAYTTSTIALGSCKYSKAEVNGTYASSTEPLDFQFSEQEFTGPSGFTFCPSSGKLDGTIRLETPNGTALKIS
jgi:hypothetical protein